MWRSRVSPVADGGQAASRLPRVAQHTGSPKPRRPSQFLRSQKSHATMILKSGSRDRPARVIVGAQCSRSAGFDSEVEDGVRGWRRSPGRRAPLLPGRSGARWRTPDSGPGRSRAGSGRPGIDGRRRCPQWPRQVATDPLVGQLGGEVRRVAVGVAATLPGHSSHSGGSASPKGSRPSTWPSSTSSAGQTVPVELMGWLSNYVSPGHKGSVTE
jgi:hypothetical protein